MSSPKNLLYTAKVCPYAARAELALALAGIQHETFQVDLFNKPEWYNKVNSASKVPVLVTDVGSEDEFKLPESLVIVEYINDLTSSLFPSSSSPQFRAGSRYIVERYIQLVQPHYISTALRGDATCLPSLRAGLIEFNTLLQSFDSKQKRKGNFIQSQTNFGYADLNIAPFIARILSASKHGILPQSELGGHIPIHTEIEQGVDGLERIKSWWDSVETVEAWQKVWNEEAYLEPAKRMVAQREAARTNK
ncbi:uncharacterized protein UTRI_05696_B [Ustilago trichophora]|uniref:GST N-terminal domain-containing protein n=1 Tax=Ustilago trichophora TaxID=86804 RepID=A0A5C3EQ69_9BASI|nr:uncharacterized protein UTRI_05696_B [Ustilago trichophora]